MMVLGSWRRRSKFPPRAATPTFFSPLTSASSSAHPAPPMRRCASASMATPASTMPACNAPYVLVTSVFDGGIYRVQPGQRVMFQHGSVYAVVDQEEGALRLSRPGAPQQQRIPPGSAQSAGLAPLPPPGPPGVVPPSAPAAATDTFLSTRAARRPCKPPPSPRPAARPRRTYMSPPKSHLRKRARRNPTSWCAWDTSFAGSSAQNRSQLQRLARENLPRAGFRNIGRAGFVTMVSIPSPTPTERDQ